MTRIFYFIALWACLSSCASSFTPFTEDLYRKAGWTESELSRIQFWLSDDIVLRRVFTGNTSEIQRGEIKVIDGRKVEEVILPKGTPGIFVKSPATNRLAISFEDGSDERFLMFGPNPKAGNRFVLLAKDWERDWGQVTYDGKLYRVSSRSAYASLLVDLKKIDRTIIDSRTAAGRKVSTP